MIYCDYTWDLYPGGILLDEELNTDKHLSWREGDYFQLVTLPSGRQMLKKVDPLIKFLRDGAEHVQKQVE